MANKNLQEKLDALAEEKISDWLEKAEFRQKNAAWIKKSQKLAFLILDRLDELDITQKKFAELAGVTPQMANKWVRGKENVTLESLIKIGTALRIDLFAKLADEPVTESSFVDIHVNSSFKMLPTVSMIYHANNNKYEFYQTAS